MTAERCRLIPNYSHPCISYHMQYIALDR